MINQNNDSVEWALLLYELDDAREHLESLIDQMNGDGEIEEEDYAVQLGHVYAHLNRAWHARGLEGEIPGDRWEEFSRFPADLKPVG